MDEYTACEQAYKNGYEQGKKDAAKHGEWIYNYGSPYTVICSVCHIERDMRNAFWNHCPNCGADMSRGEE